jgi:uncharacterized protein (TIGR02594 family)
MKNEDWMTIANREIGIKTFPDGESNPRITEYHQGTNITGYDDKAAWCSSFLNWVLIKSGYSGTNSALARSWLEWGIELREPRLGCIVILEREHPSGWQGHVGFFLRVDDDRVFLLGGNQLGEVREHSYPLSSVLGYRWPTS